MAFSILLAVPPDGIAKQTGNSRNGSHAGGSSHHRDSSYGKITVDLYAAVFRNGAFHRPCRFFPLLSPRKQRDSFDSLDYYNHSTVPTHGVQNSTFLTTSSNRSGEICIFNKCRRSGAVPVPPAWLAGCRVATMVDNGPHFCRSTMAQAQASFQDCKGGNVLVGSITNQVDGIPVS